MSEDRISLYDTFRSNTSRILKELELQTPMYFQIYSDMYREYLHRLDTVFGMCMTAEREFMDKVGVDQRSLGRLNDFAADVTDNWLRQISAYGEFLQKYSQTRSSGAKSYDRLMHTMITAYIQTVECSSVRMDVTRWWGTESQ